MPVAATAATAVGGLVGMHDPVSGAVTAGSAAALIEVFRSERKNRVEHFASSLGGQIRPDTLATSLASSSRLRDIFIEAVDAAMSSDWTMKRVLLARSVARAANDGGRIDVEAMLIRAARNVENVHAQLLAYIDANRAEGDQAGRVVGGVKPSELAERFGPDPVPINAALGVLGGEGLALNVGLGTFDSVEAWGPTDFGKAFLQWLEDAEAPSTE